MAAHQPLSSVPRPSRASIAYSGLVTVLAAVSVMAPIAPGVALQPMLGVVLVAAAILGVVVELVQYSQGRTTFWLRALWAALGATAGGVLMLADAEDHRSVRYALAGFLAAQAVILAFCAMRARRLRELGGLPLGVEGVLSLALAVFVALAFPFDQGWVLGAIVAVGLLDYAAALSFLSIREDEQERARPLRRG
jgi:uncharacterized membrane protein HdeD (DUF308 family)